MNIHIIRRSSLHFFTNSYHKLAENPDIEIVTVRGLGYKAIAKA